MIHEYINKAQALHALQSGQKIAHRFFDDNEYIELHPIGLYRFEDGVTVSPETFWASRIHPSWDEDWGIWHDPECSCDPCINAVTGTND